MRHPDPEFDTDDDLPEIDRARRTVVVASEARTGSTLLCSALGRTGKVGRPLEYLQPVWFESGHRVFGWPLPTPRERRRRVARRVTLRRHWWGYRDIESSTLPQYIDALVRRRTTPNGVFGLKIHWETYRRCCELDGFDVGMLPQPISWVHVTRDDLVAQAVSFVKASQSGVFAVSGRGPRFSAPVRYDDDALVAAFHRFRNGAAQWSNFFEQQGVDPIRITYEELDTAYDSAVARVLTGLGFTGTAVPPLLHRRQADDTNAAWATRFRANHPDLARLSRSSEVR